MATLEDGFYTITKVPTDYAATLFTLDPETPVVTLPPSKVEAPNQRVGSISYSYSRIYSYDIIFPPPVGGHEDTEGNLYHNQWGKVSVVRWGT
jgi:hypothetical protein